MPTILSMQITSYPDRESWLEARKGKITGTMLKEIATAPTTTKDDILAVLEGGEVEFKKSWTKEVLTGLLTDEQKQTLLDTSLAKSPRKIGFYKLIADQLATPDGWTDPMERGSALEKDAIELFAKLNQKEVNTDQVIWTRDDNSNIAISPDGYIEDGFIINEAVEIKCLSSEKHMQAIIEDRLPEEYEFQVLQYFIVNDDLETLYFFMYDPRLPDTCDYKCFKVMRAEKQEEVDLYLAQQKKLLEQVEEYVNKYQTKK